jgi:DNA polymerase gamma 1
MDYLIRRFNLTARLAITVHDEIRYLVKNEDKYRAAMALQVANVWTRAMFSQQLGIDDLPQSCAYFSAVDVDHVLRKEVDMDCITPSHPSKIPHGESLDILALLDKGPAAFLDPTRGHPLDLHRFDYVPRVPVISDLQRTQGTAYLRAQISQDDAELRAIIQDKAAADDCSRDSDSSSSSTKRKPKTKTASSAPHTASTTAAAASATQEQEQEVLASTSLRPHYPPQSPRLLPVDEMMWTKGGGTRVLNHWEQQHHHHARKGPFVPMGLRKGVSSVGRF